MSGTFDRVMMQWYPDDEKYYCDKCEETCNEDDMIEIDGEMVCEQCALDAIECDECHELHFEENMTCIDEKWVCTNCEENVYPICVISGKQFYDPTMENIVAPEYRHKHLQIAIITFIRKLKYFKARLKYKMFRYKHYDN